MSRFARPLPRLLPALLSSCAVLGLCGSLLGARVQSPDGAAGAVIRGRVDVRRSHPQVDRRPALNDVTAPVTHDPGDVGRPVVYLESGPAAAFAAGESRHAIMDQRNETFVPHVLAITAGTTVDFPNSDHTYHNVFSLRGPKPFDLGRYAAGRTKSVRFDRPGIARVFCEIHSHMSAFILIFNHRYFAVAAPDGRYQISRVPPGRYTVSAWSEGRVRESRQVVVPDEGSVDADFMLR